MKTFFIIVCFLAMAVVVSANTVIYNHAVTPGNKIYLYDKINAATVKFSIPCDVVADALPIRPHHAEHIELTNTTSVTFQQADLYKIVITPRVNGTLIITIP